MNSLPDYGFPKRWDPSLDTTQVAEKLAASQAQNEAKWQEYFDKIGGYGNIKELNDELRELIHGGIPHSFRPVIWAHFLHINEKMDAFPELYDELSQCDSQLSAKTLRVIIQDVNRTFLGSTSFTKEELHRVLVAFAAYHPDLGYCQGMSYIASVLIAICGEMPSFWMLDTIVTEILPPRYFTLQMEDFKIDLHVLDTLVLERAPKFYRHAKSLGFDWQMTVGGWFLSLFATSLPIPTCLRIFDCVFSEGDKVLFRVSIATSTSKLRKNILPESLHLGQCLGSFFIICNSSIN